MESEKEIAQNIERIIRGRKLEELSQEDIKKIARELAKPHIISCDINYGGIAQFYVERMSGE